MYGLRFEMPAGEPGGPAAHPWPGTSAEAMPLSFQISLWRLALDGTVQGLCHAAMWVDPRKRPRAIIVLFFWVTLVETCQFEGGYVREIPYPLAS